MLNKKDFIETCKRLIRIAEKYMETKDELFLRKALDELDSLFLSIVERIQI